MNEPRISPRLVSRAALATTVLVVAIGVAVATVEATLGGMIRPPYVVMWLVLTAVCGSTTAITYGQAVIAERLPNLGEAAAVAYRAGLDDRSDVPTLRR